LIVRFLVWPGQEVKPVWLIVGPALVVAPLLATASWNAWLILVEEEDA
jgi:hypothetical protein